MPRGMGSLGSNWIVSLLVLALAGAVGYLLPALQAPSAPHGQHVSWTAPDTPSPLSQASSTPTASPAPSVILDAPDGAVLAWQEPGPATPSSVPVFLPTATPSPRLPTRTPAAAATATELPPSRAHLGLTPTAAPSATSTPTPTPTARAASQPAPPARAASAPTVVRSARADVAGLTAPAPQAAAPARALPPALIAPPLETRLNGVAQFVWRPTSALPENAYYEVVVWSPEQNADQAWGVAPPVLNQSLWINLDDLFRSGRFREGSLYWTVLVIRQEPYQRLTLPGDSERRYLVYATGG